ncbi:MAG: hypothetical protein ABI416_17545 [Ginsengibacter sp.]
MLKTVATGTIIKKINLAVFSLFYFSAGCNHFLRPANYLAMIPPYFPYKELVNYSSGILEIACSVLMLFRSRAKMAMRLTIFLLIAFIPAHIYLIQRRGCISDNFCFPAWVAWVRLFPFQFLLVWWAYKTSQLQNDRFPKKSHIGMK